MPSSAPNPAVLWDHDRRLIANWLWREASGGFDKAEIRADGSSFISIPSALGPVSVHDYWSFARRDFNSANRLQGYQEALQRQVPILSFGYNRPGAPPAQLIVFLNGELTVEQGLAQSFLPFIKDKKTGELIAVETKAGGSDLAPAEPYADPFLRGMLGAVRIAARHPPGF